VVKLGFILPRTMKLVNAVSARLHPNRATADPATLTAYGRAMPLFLHLWNPPRDARWDLITLGVDPAHQGKGVGRKLVAWGMKLAIEENVTASVVSADGKDKFYNQCGFDVLGGNVTDGDGNPMADIRGGNVFFKDKKQVAVDNV
jgi:GNAT superfamily N-acetyltransferase